MVDLVIGGLSKTTFQKLRRMKQDQRFGDRTWAEWIRHLVSGVRIEETPSEKISKATQESLGKVWMENFVKNIPMIIDLETYPDEKDTRSVGKLPKLEGPGIVVAAGPSIQKHRHIEALAESGWAGGIFACDRMLIPLLRAGVTPEKFPHIYVVSIDGNRDLIVKWFDDPLVDRYAEGIVGLFASTVANNAIKRFAHAGGRPYFFHGMLDDFATFESVTSFMNLMTGSTCVSALGNVGATCWTLAQYLGCSPILLIGMDYGYRDDTPIEETAYYKHLKEVGIPTEQILTLFRRGYNPDFDTYYRTDLVFRHYREGFLNAVAMSPTIMHDPGPGKGLRPVKLMPTTTLNCTEGGSLHGEGISAMTFNDALAKYSGHPNHGQGHGHGHGQDEGPKDEEKGEREKGREDKNDEKDG